MKGIAGASKLTRICTFIFLLAGQGASAFQQESGTITGQIRAVDGMPAVGVRVVAVAELQPGPPSPDATPDRITTTDGEGRYRLEGLLPGRYVIAAGGVDQPTYYPGVLSIADSGPVTVTAGANVSRIDVSLVDSGVRVTGRVAGLPANMPPNFIRVYILARGSIPGSARQISTMAAPDGTFEFQKVPPGVWEIRTDRSVAVPPRNFLQFEANGSDIGPIELQAGAFIVGRVTVDDGTPLPVALTPTYWSIFADPRATSIAGLPSLLRLLRIPPAASLFASNTLAVVRGNGDFVLSNLPPGDYRIGAQVPFGLAIKSMTFNDQDILQTPMKITDAGNAKGNLRVVLSRESASAGVRVSGRVTGPPLTESARISMRPRDDSAEGGTGEVMVRPDGTFEFIGVPRGAYVAQVGTMTRPFAMQVSAEVVVGDTDLTNVEVPNLSLTPPR